MKRAGNNSNFVKHVWGGQPLVLQGQRLNPFEVDVTGRIQNTVRKKMVAPLSLADALLRWNHHVHLTRAGNIPLKEDDLVFSVGVLREGKEQLGGTDAPTQTMWIYMPTPKHRPAGCALPEMPLKLSGIHNVGWYFLQSKAYCSLVHGPSLAEHVFAK